MTAAARDAKLAAMLALCAKATPGPWSASCRHVDGPKEGDLVGISNWPVDEWLQCELIGPNCNVGRGDMIGPDAAYIAACSPEVVAALVRVALAARMLYDDTADYITINHLGPVEHNQSMSQTGTAMRALDAALESRHEQR